MIAYQELIHNKIVKAPLSGYTIPRTLLHPTNKPHQADIVLWAAQGGRRAIFARFGLGKTRMQLQLAHHSLKKYGGRKLIICPLGVISEFNKDASALGIEITKVTCREEYILQESGIFITNYQRVRDGNFEANDFDFVSLDEASAIRSLGSKTYIHFNRKFQRVRERYVATATPSPNDYIELLNYASFLGIMDVSQAKTRFFQRNSEKADELTLHPHKIKEFWTWVRSWAVFITKPSDLGYSDDGYDLPKLNVHFHMIPDIRSKLLVDEDGQLKMFKEQPKDLAAAATVKKETIDTRVQKAVEIIKQNEPGRHWVIWHDLEPERKQLEKVLGNEYGDNYKSVFGSQPDDLKEELLNDFADGKYPLLGTKKEIAAQGRNFQHHCYSEIFLGINYKFNDFIQAIHRVHRFLQNHDCDIHIIYMECEEHILNRLMTKWKQHDEEFETMREIMQAYGLNCIELYEELKRSIGVKREVVNGNNFTAVFNDAVEELSTMESNSVDLQFSSWPFSNQYEYSPNYNDFGHNDSNEAFFEQCDYLVPETIRVLKPGRIHAIHVKDRIVFGNFSGLGMPTVYEFSDDVVRCCKKHGLLYCGRITLVTDVVRENKQTRRLGWSEQCKDGTKMSVGLNEYILLFRKQPTDNSNAYADDPVVKTKLEYTRSRWQIDAHGFYRSSGNRLLMPSEIAKMPLDQAMRYLKNESLTNVYDYERHVAIAEALDEAGKLPSSYMVVDPQSWNSNVWADVIRMRNLNTSQGQRKEEQHLCPLPIDITKRVIIRYSNPGDLVQDYFAGLFTVPYVAIQEGRRGHGIELNPYYFKEGVRFCMDAEYKASVPTLFDAIKN